MRLVINTILLLIAAALVYVLYNSIKEPIAFDSVREYRKNILIEKLETIRDVQEMYRDITGGFAPTFDTLSELLKRDSFTLVAVIGDPDDPNFTGEITYDTTKESALDAINALNINLDSLRYVPFGGGEEFKITATEIDYQATKQPVVEVGTPWKTFMGKYGSEHYQKYDQMYKPNSFMKFGDLNKPNLSGNWE